MIVAASTGQGSLFLSLAGGSRAGYPWYVWAIFGAVALLSLTSAAHALTSRIRRSRGPAPPADQRRVRPGSVLLWIAIVAVAALIGVGVVAVGSG